MPVEEPSVAYTVDDVAAYLECPLKGRYATWGAKRETREPNEAVIEAFEAGVGTYLAGAARGREFVALAERDSEEMFRYVLRKYDKEGLFNGQNVLNSSEMLVKGVKLLEGMHIYLRRYTIVHGPVLELPVRIGDAFVYGKILGVCSIIEEGVPEKRGMFYVHHPSKPRTPGDRFREGFLHAVTPLVMGTNSRYVTILCRLDPVSYDVKYEQMVPGAKQEFLGLAESAVAGMMAGAYPPSPDSYKCGHCSFSAACKLKYARTSPGTEYRREFLAEWKKSEEQRGLSRAREAEGPGRGEPDNRRIHRLAQ